jgi:uncharacterized membrane protein
MSWGTRFRAREWLDRSWIVIPSVYVAAALVLGKLVPALESGDVGPFGLSLDRDSARAILEAVAGGMIAFTGFVVSIAVVVVQFGASQYTPRLVLRFRRDKVVKHALGIFVAPALYALVALVDIGDGDVPNLTVAVAVAMLLGAVFAFFTLTARLLDLLRPRRLYSQLRVGCERAIDQVYPELLAAEPAGAVTEPAAPAGGEPIRYRGRSGVLSALDRERLLELATAAEATVEVALPVGAFVDDGASLFHVRGATGELPLRDLQRAAIVAEERTLTQDPAFAIRAIVDIAIRALSPAVNDPTTAVQGLDVLEPILHRLAERDLGRGAIRDAGGSVRVVYPAPDWPDLVALALTEIRSYGAPSHQVTRRMRALLEELRAELPPARRPAIDAQLALLAAAVERAHPDPAERALAATADHMGLGGHVSGRS